MSLPSNPVALRARYVFPVDRPPIPGGWVTIADGRIAAVDDGRGDRPVIDLGDAAILPGFVNAHTHLEFSSLAAPLGQPGEPLPAWIRHVVDYRRGGAVSPSEAILAGLQECLATGTTTIGEIATPGGWTPDGGPARAMPAADVTLFYEVIALSVQQSAERFADAERHLRAPWPADHIRPGLSPHAPYTVQPRSVRRLVALARRKQVPIAMHLAESREELELLQTGGGPFRELLEELQVWVPNAFPIPTRPLEYLEMLANAPRSLVVHGNYLDARETEFLAQRADSMAVVYCPRTHHYFRHEPYSLAGRLASGVRIALGTDSRASNPDLNLLDEMRFVAENHPQIRPQTVLELGTIAGARALGVANESGSLTPGKLANLAILQVPQRTAADPHELLLDPAARVVQTWWHGQKRFTAEPQRRNDER